MFKNYIKEARALNQLDLDAFEGKRLYYSQIKNSINSFIWLLFIIAIFCLIGSEIKNDVRVLFYLLLLLLFIYAFQESIGRILLKNPLFILDGDRLYYIKTNQWYDISEYTFGDEYVGRGNFFQTYCMYDKNKNKIFQEKNWYLKNEDGFKRLLKYNRTMKLKGKQLFSL